MDSPTIRVGMPALALYIFYWGIFLAPPAEEEEAEPGALSFVETRKLISSSREMIDQGNYPKALEMTMKLHNAYPQSHVYLQQLAVIHEHLGRFADEATALEKYIQNSPTPTEVCPEIGKVYLRLSNFTKAKDAFERCLSFDDGNTDSLFYLAYFNERFGNAKTAEALYIKGLQLSPRYPDLQLGLARLKLRRGEAKSALELSQKALERNPNNTDALLVAGLAAKLQGDANGALAYFRKGLMLSPENHDLRIALARLGGRNQK